MDDAAVMEAPVEAQASEAATLPESTGKTEPGKQQEKQPEKQPEKVDNRQNPDALRKALNLYANPPGAPSAPSALTATASSASQINLTWTASPTSGP